MHWHIRKTDLSRFAVHPPDTIRRAQVDDLIEMEVPRSKARPRLRVRMKPVQCDGPEGRDERSEKEETLVVLDFLHVALKVSGLSSCVGTADFKDSSLFVRIIVWCATARYQMPRANERFSTT